MNPERFDCMSREQKAETARAALLSLADERYTGERLEEARAKIQSMTVERLVEIAEWAMAPGTAPDVLKGETVRGIIEGEYLK